MFKKVKFIENPANKYITENLRQKPNSATQLTFNPLLLLPVK